MEPIRILHEVTIMNTGGIETLLMNIYRNIDREKVQFDFMLHRDIEGFYDEEIKSLGGRLYYGMPFNPLKHKSYLNSLDDVLLEHKNEYKIIHAHNDFSMFTLRAAKKVGIPIRICHSHNSKPRFDKKKYIFKKYNKIKLKNYTTHMFACSNKAAKWLYGNKAVEEGRVKLINNGIEPEKFIYNETIRNDIRKQLNIENKYVIGHVGRFDTQKNHKFIIKVFNEVLKSNKDSVLILIGEGGLKEEIKEQANTFGIINNIIFIDATYNVNKYIQGMDLFLFPSLYEGLGIVAIEAQAAGLQCVVADTIPREAFITKNIHALSLKESLENWSKEILKYNNGYERKDTSEIIRKSGYDIKEVAKGLEEFYLSCANDEEILWK